MLLQETEISKSTVKYIMCIEYKDTTPGKVKLDYQNQLCETNNLTYMGNYMFGSLSPVHIVVELVTLKDKNPQLNDFILDMCLLRVTDADDLMKVIK
jgi:hypothetical protein